NRPGGTAVPFPRGPRPRDNRRIPPPPRIPRGAAPSPGDRRLPPGGDPSPRGPPVRPTPRPWPAREDELVRTLSPREATRQTGRTAPAVYQRRHLLDVSRLGRRWTDAEDRLLARLPPALAVQYLRRTPASLKARCRTLGLAEA